MTRLAIGEILYPGWNGAKELGDESVANCFKGVRVEAVGVDWVVVRDVASGEVLSATFDSPEQLENFLDNMEA